MYNLWHGAYEAVLFKMKVFTATSLQGLHSPSAKECCVKARTGVWCYFYCGLFSGTICTLCKHKSHEKSNNVDRIQLVQHTRLPLISYLYLSMENLMRLWISISKRSIIAAIWSEVNRLFITSLDAILHCHKRNGQSFLNSKF